jgi:hypothetical protein
MALFVLSSPVSIAQYSDARYNGKMAAVPLRVDLPTALAPPAGLPQQLSTVPYRPWRTRPKSVLEETNDKIADELDLGPATEPSQPPHSPSHKLIHHRLAAALRLRC